MTFQLTRKQEAQRDLMGSDAAHVMAFGGSRSGKTFGFVRGTVTRAVAHPSRHVMLRYRFNAIKTSIILDTLPKVMELCFPDLAPKCSMDKTDWFFAIPTDDSNSRHSRKWSEIFFGGLDDKARTEKILGQEYATVFLNECSQIPWASRNIAMTRLAQNTPLRLKAYYDCNPPGMAHWTYRLFIEKRDPDRRTGIANPSNYGALLMNPADNQENLPPSYMEELQAMNEAMRRRFLLGQFADLSESALWTLELLDQQRIVDGNIPEMVRIVIAIDPSGASGEEDKRSDEVGMVVVGLGRDGRGYLLEDLSGRMGPAQWGKAAVAAFDRYEADCIVAEENFGGAMVAEVIRGAATDRDRKTGGQVPYRAVHASRGKIVRAEPISALYDQQKISHVGYFPDLEDQLLAMTTAGYVGSKSPDRADALVWALAHLFPAMTKKEAPEGGHRKPQVLRGRTRSSARR
ncbi:phage terminase large subunit [Pelagibacterium luteolum]|uniref:Terminase-like family protein n=1 Tax=Pelagibacterium luteolum TaxID=440168 RepID=A0A1G7ZHY6_9HYPH|nr:phage terminase large subunit [Pelagibacterium luteolum]SDH08294.1 Terminase-like family protein [Pelagibacterium luteolum]